MNWTSITIGTLLLIFSFTADARTVGRIFKDTVLISLSASEIASLKTFIGESLSQANDGETRVWKSNESSTTGLLKTSVTYQYADKTCRRALIGLKSEDDKRDYWRFDFCEYDGQWKYTPTPLVNLSAEDRTSLLETARFMLSHGATKKPVSWRSKNQKMYGALVLLDDSQDCREVSVSLLNDAGSEISGVYSFCLEGDVWEFSGEK